MAATVEQARACLAAGQHEQYDRLKRSLPAFCFMASFEKSRGAKGNRPENTWRLQRAAHLTGLVMLDVDHLEEDPRQVFASIPEHWRDDDCDSQILLAHVTPSGHGLRLVCKADARRGNLADNQQHLYTALGLKGDGCIKNADRLSFAVGKKDIIYLDPQLFTYENAEYDKMFGDQYRHADSRATKTRTQAKAAAQGVLFAGESGGLCGGQPSRTTGMTAQPVPSLQGEGSGVGSVTSKTPGETGTLPLHSEAGTLRGDKITDITDPTPAPPLEGRGVPNGVPAADGAARGVPNGVPAADGGPQNTSPSYRGVPYQAIVEKWLQVYGTPVKGERHTKALKLAGDLRYICDNNADAICRALACAPFVQDMCEEGAAAEIRAIADDVVTRKMNLSMPLKLRQALKLAGVAEDDSTASDTATEEEAEAQRKMQDKYDEFWSRLKPLLGGDDDPYALATYRMDDVNKLGGVFAAGTMFCTLMTRCWYRHFDGNEQRMNPQAYIIGDPASGKGETEKIDQLIMAPVIVADRVGREAEAEYKRQQKERATSSKAQKGEALKRPEYCIRYLPSRTSNAVFFRRAKNAFEEHDDEKFRLHLYTFDSELDGNTTAQSGGAWIGKHDLELKAFHNEFTGVDFANADSVNEIIQVFYNSVVTGTPISLSRKVTPRNVNDGLCSRMAIFKMMTNGYKMIARGNPNLNHDKNCKLKQWAFKLDKLHGEMPIGPLVDHVYSLCEQSAYTAEATSDRVLDYLRKRAVFYATWFTVPRIAARAISQAANMEGEPNAVQLMTVQPSDLDFASLVYDAVIYFQDLFFGRMLQESWENAERDLQQRRKHNSNNSITFAALPREFSVQDVMKELDVSYNAARSQVFRWRKGGYIEDAKKGFYKKLTDIIK
ncbi:MAG: hypothetical protein K6B13_11165 [Prevotella sp.]|nr:hypothetical protein [Prevotella sp.]